MQIRKKVPLVLAFTLDTSTHKQKSCKGKELSAGETKTERCNSSFDIRKLSIFTKTTLRFILYIHL